jgi:3-deoxy-manno-octulosonate cytidylyltransferase (CMP-KDO synthetase)
MVRALGVIPARFASTRFPGKPLAPLGGCTLLERVWLRASKARRIERLVVATDDERIAEACRSFGAEALMTSPDHASGTDRVAEIALRLDRSFGVLVNIQGDEPFVTATCLDRLVEAFAVERPPEMATLAEPLADAGELFDPNVVKVVTTLDGRALYFSRAPIPYHRGNATRLAADFREALADRPGGLSGYRKHQGIYAYRRETLLALTRLRPSPLERDEGLEQLRALQAGLAIRVLDSDFHSVAVDTPEDLARAASRIAETREP